MNPDERSQALIPIACRFVASDQWLITQFDATWKISEVKRYILTKVYSRRVTNYEHPPPRGRPVSPITFASVLRSRNSFDSSDGPLEDDSTRDPEVFVMEPIRPVRGRHPPTPRVASPAFPGSPTEKQHALALPPHHYAMLAFSTGQLLEDDFSLAWYRLRPHELLELHPPGTIVRLQRETVLDYIQPYLELDVRALRVVINDKDAPALVPTHGLEAPPGKIRRAKDLAVESRSPSGSGGGSSSSMPQSIRKRRKMKLEWRDRYLVIRQGMLSLFKSRSDLTPVHTCSLTTLTTLRGQEDVVQTATAATPSPHVICAKFRVEGCAPSAPESNPSSPPAGVEQWTDPWSGETIPRETEGFLWGRRESKEDMKQQRKNTAEGSDRSRGGSIPKEDQHESRAQDVKNESLLSFLHDNIGDVSQGIWLILDTLDEFAYSNLLRVLHRCSPDIVNSTLVPSYLFPDSSVSSSPSSTSSPLSSLASGLRRQPCPYPEWRMELSQRAQKSGMGDISDAMSWMLWGPPVEFLSPKLRGTELRKKGSHLTTENSGTPSDPLDFDVCDEGGGDDGDCELEWDSWVNDLARQARASTSKHIAVTVTDSPSMRPTHFRERLLGAKASYSTVSTAGWCEQVAPTSSSPIPRHLHHPSDILPGVNMDLLSVHSPALLTTPSVLPFQSTGVTTSTVSVGGVVRTRSLILNDGGRGRGVARAMEVLSEDGAGGGGGRSGGKHRAGKQKRGREEHARNAVSPARGTATPPLGTSTPPLGTITSTVTVREAGIGIGTGAAGTSGSGSGAWSPPPPYISRLAEAPPGMAVGGHAALETASTASTTTTTRTTIQILPARSSSRKGSDRKAGKGRRFKGSSSSSSSRGKAFSPERLVSKLDSALDFVTG